MDQTRILPLEGIRNFRDYGGYAAADGTTVKRRTMWRSGHHHGATRADLEAVDALPDEQRLGAISESRPHRDRGARWPSCVS